MKHIQLFEEYLNESNIQLEFDPFGYANKNIEVIQDTDYNGSLINKFIIKNKKANLRITISRDRREKPQSNYDIHLSVDNKDKKYSENLFKSIDSDFEVSGGGSTTSRSWYSSGLYSITKDKVKSILNKIKNI
jgi:hypothetical protein